MFKKDTLYQHATDVIDFDFDKKVAHIFPDMVHRSIPGYAALLNIMQAVFRAQLLHSSKALIYDLGCSVGGVTLALSRVLPINTHFIGVDVSADMLVQYKKATHLADLSDRVQALEASIVNLPLKPCQGISINFTLQFLHPDERQQIINQCHSSLEKNGLLFIAEKTLSNKETVTWHEQFKRNNGYSELEIAQKRMAIENVMKIDNEDTIIARCHQAGFNNVTPVFNALGFKAWVMEK